MNCPQNQQARHPGLRAAVCLLILGLGLSPGALAHIVPPEELHPTAHSYRQLAFLLNLNPVSWDQARARTAVIADELEALSPEEGRRYRSQVAAVIDGISNAEGGPDPRERKAAARKLFELSTRAVTRTLESRLLAARRSLADYESASRHLDEARQIWAAFEHEVKATDRRGFLEIGKSWLELAMALGTPGISGVGSIEPDTAGFDRESRAVIDYLRASYGEAIALPASGELVPVPAASPTFDPGAAIPAKLPPGSDINKQLPRPRQILNMATRGVDESETALIALGDMAFDSSAIFGDPARSFAMSCNTCHNKSITNPRFFIPGLSSRRGGMDVSNNYFAPHATNGHFDPLDIPDLRGIRFTAPYGRNGRLESLREFTRNVIVNEFNGPEPDPTLLDGMVAYMMEFDFLPNPLLRPDGTLSDEASPAAKRGQTIFNRPFEQMGGRACATCHVPSDNFLDRKRHDIGTVRGSEAGSRDRTLDTPTLLSTRYTAPYFHDGSAPTLRAVNEWFNGHYRLGLSAREIDDLTAYLETVGDGVEPYEDTTHTLEAEMEEFHFFLSAYEFLESKNKPELIRTTFETIAFEIRAHKWDVQDPGYMPVLDRLAGLMDEAHDASLRGDRALVDRKVAEYRDLYRANAEHLR